MRMKELTLEEIIEDLHAIEERLQLFEKKYRCLSDSFYKFYLAGKVEDSLELIEWIGLIKMKMEREAEYESFLLSSAVSLPFSAKSD